MRLPFAILPAIVLLAAPARSATTTFQPVRDNTVYSSSGSTSNGSGPTFVAGRAGAGAYTRGLVKFNLASIPAHSTITGVTLTLQVMRTMSGLQSYRLHRLTRDWGEAGSISHGGGGQGNVAETGDATWEFAFYPSDPWTTLGGDFVAAPSGEMTVDEGTGTFTSTPGLVADIQQWVDAPLGNFGWLVMGTEGSDVTAKAFASREEPLAALRPALTVEYDISTATRTATWGRIKAAYR